MVTLKLTAATANLASVHQRLAVGADQIDKEFGVVAISPDEGLYVVLVDADVADRLEGCDDVVGTFSNPRIEPLGPPS